MGLRDVRLKRRLSQEQLAELSGVEQSYISTLETSSDPNVGWHIVRKLARALRAKPHDLFPREGRDREAHA